VISPLQKQQVVPRGSISEGLVEFLFISKVVTLWPKGIRPFGIPGRSAQGRSIGQVISKICRGSMKQTLAKCRSLWMVTEKKNEKKPFWKFLLPPPKCRAAAIKSPRHNVKLLHWKKKSKKIHAAVKTTRKIIELKNLNFFLMPTFYHAPSTPRHAAPVCPCIIKIISSPTLFIKLSSFA
jgi:hypothetical protein